MSIFETVSDSAFMNGHFVLLQIRHIGEGWVWDMRVEGAKDSFNAGPATETLADARADAMRMAAALVIGSEDAEALGSE